MASDSVLHAAALLLILLGGALTGWWARARVRAWLTRRLFQRGFAGQRRARLFLENNGYHIIGEEVSLEGNVEIDGETRTYEVRIDFVVECERRRYGVEVKTGAQAANPLNRATRRQLLEYAWLAQGLDGLLLLDMEAERLASIRFPAPALANTDPLGKGRTATNGWRAATLALALALAIVLLAR